MKVETISERTYKIAYHQMASKGQAGWSVEVTGDSKAKVIREAKELMTVAQQTIREASAPVTTPEVGEPQ